MYADAMQELTVTMPRRLAALRFPKALDDRLHRLLVGQNRTGRLWGGPVKALES